MKQLSASMHFTMRLAFGWNKTIVSEHEEWEQHYLYESMRSDAGERWTSSHGLLTMRSFSASSRRVWIHP
jgi:hypothetical protein